MKNINRYSPKEALALMIMANENASFKELDNLVLTLEQILLVKKNKTEILKNIDSELITRIENYWELKKSQVIAYAYLVFNHFKISSENLNSKNITDNFIYQMRLYSPDNAVEFVERNFNIDLNKEKFE